MPKLIKLSEDKRKELGNEIVDEWFHDSTDKESWIADLTKWLYAYQGRDIEKNIPFEGASNLHVPVTATVVDTIHPRMMAALTRPKPIVGFKPQEENDFELARSREIFLDWAMREEINIFPILDRVVLNTLINGVQFTKQTWELRIRRVRDQHKFPLDTDPQQILEAILGEESAFVEAMERVVGGEKLKAKLNKRDVELEFEKTERAIVVYTDREEIVYDAPVIVMVNPEDMMVPSNATFDLQQADHITERYFKTWDEIKREIKKGVFEVSDEDQVKMQTMLSRDENEDDATSDVKYLKEDITGSKEVYREGGPERICLLDSYRKYDVDDDGYEEEVIVTVVRDAPQIILRMVRLEEVFRHGLRPFVCWYFNPVAKSIWAIGVPQILEGLQKEFNIIHNQRTDIGMLTATPFGVYVPAAGFNPEKMPVEPGWMYPVEDINAVKWYSAPSSPAWSFQEESGLWSLVERRMKVNDLTMGRIGDTQGAARTASGVQALTAQQATGFDIYIRRFQEAFKLCCQQILALYQQYMPPGKSVRIVGLPGDPVHVVSRKDILGNMDMEFTGNSLSTDRQIERETLTFLAQSILSPGSFTMLLQLGISDPQGVAEWYRKLLGAFDINGLERIIKIPEHQPLLTPDEVVNKLMQGEDPKPQQGENHEDIVKTIQAMLQGPDGVGIPAENRIAMQKHILARAQQAQQEFMMQQMQQMLMQQQMAQQIQMYGGVQPPGFGGAPVPPQPPQSGLAYAPPGGAPA